jgi:hypothetical protein
MVAAANVTNSRIGNHLVRREFMLAVMDSLDKVA